MDMHTEMIPIPNTEKLEASIRQFHERASEVQRTFEIIDSVLDMSPESEFREALWALNGGYIQALDDAYNMGGWLEWWHDECRLGATPLQAAPPGGELRTIATIDDFVALVIELVKDDPLEEILAPRANDEQTDLLDAAKAVIDRWDSPQWKNIPATGEYINRLRAVVAAVEKGKSDGK